VERVLDTYADVLAEAVYNPLAIGLHGPWNLAAIAAGKHVLTEKPSASDAVDVPLPVPPLLVKLAVVGRCRDNGCPAR
jgi:hypothetical protein